MLKLKLPKNIKINWGLNFIKIEGPLGVLVKRKDDFSLAIKNDDLYLWSTQNELKESSYLVTVRNLILGVSKGYRQRLKLVGVGFRAIAKDNKIFLKIGFSHEVAYTIPKDVQITPSKIKGAFLLLKGKEKERVSRKSVV